MFNPLLLIKQAPHAYALMTVFALIFMPWLAYASVDRTVCKIVNLLVTSQVVGGVAIIAIIIRLKLLYFSGTQKGFAGKMTAAIGIQIALGLAVIISSEQIVQTIHGQRSESCQERVVNETARAQWQQDVRAARDELAKYESVPDGSLTGNPSDPSVNFSYRTKTSIGSWQAGNAGIEIWAPSMDRSTPGGGHIVEMDTYANTNIWQEINTTEGVEYDLSFHYKSRTASSSSDISVWIDGVKINHISENNSSWHNHNYRFTGNGNPIRIEFKGEGSSNGYGGLLSDFKVQKSSAAQQAAQTALDQLLGNPPP